MAPASATTSAVAAKVNAGTKTASPGPMSHARRTSSSASVPLAQATACLTLTNGGEPLLERCDLRTEDPLAAFDGFGDRAR